MTDRCTLTDLPANQCGCKTHRRHTRGTVISAAALERLLGRPTPEYRTRTRVRLDSDSGTLTQNAKPLDRLPDTAELICQACGEYPHPRDRWLCDWCAEQWEIDLLNAPIIAAELDKAIAKQAHMSDNPGSSSEDPLPYNPSAARARARLNRAALDAARRLRVRPWTAAAVLDATRDTISHHRDAPELAAELRSAIRQALATIDRPRPTIYLGPCPTCRLATHVPEGATTHTCPCGQIIIVAQALADREAAIADVLVTWQELVDAHIAPRSTVYWWRKHHLLLPVTDWCGQPMYRLGDAKDLRDRKPDTTG